MILRSCVEAEPVMYALDLIWWAIVLAAVKDKSAAV
jgi:hypothetical protein